VVVALVVLELAQDFQLLPEPITRLPSVLVEMVLQLRREDRAGQILFLALSLQQAAVVVVRIACRIPLVFRRADLEDLVEVGLLPKRQIPQQQEALAIRQPQRPRKAILAAQAHISQAQQRTIKAAAAGHQQ